MVTSNYPGGFHSIALTHRSSLAATNVTVIASVTDDDDGIVVVRTNLTIRPLPMAAQMQLVQRIAPETVRIQGQGTVGARYLLQASSDLRAWSSIATVTPTSAGLFSYTNLERTQYEMRFYRAIWDTQSPIVRFGDIWRLPNGVVRMKLVGRPLAEYRLEKADGFELWGHFTNVITSADGIAVIDDLPGPGKTRLYRAVDAAVP